MRPTLYEFAGGEKAFVPLPRWSWDGLQRLAGQETTWTFACFAPPARARPGTATAAPARG